MRTGTTATVAIVSRTQIVIAQVGDSRALLVSRAGHKVLTVEHRPTNDAERSRVVKSGACGQYVLAQLCVDA